MKQIFSVEWPYGRIEATLIAALLREYFIKLEYHTDVLVTEIIEEEYNETGNYGSQQMD